MIALGPGLPAAIVLAAGVRAAGVTVVAEPPDTRCPPAGELAAALAARVPDDVRGWVARYRVDAAGPPAAPRRLTLGLYDQRGRARLARELEIGADGCAAAAEGLALILERFFEEVSWTAAVPLPEIERAPEPPPPGRRRELAAGAAARRAFLLQLGLALDLRASLGPGSRWLVSAGLVTPFVPNTDSLDGYGGVDLLSFPLRGSLRWSQAAGRLGLEVGPVATVSIERAAVTGALRGNPAYRAVPALGGVAAARWSLSPDWAITLEAGLDVMLYHRSFAVAGVGEVVAPQRIQALGVIGVARAIAR